MSKSRALVGLLWVVLAVGVVALILPQQSPAQEQPPEPPTNEEQPLTITKTVSPQPVDVGQELTFTITVTNTSTEPAGGLLVFNILSPPLEFVSVTTTIPGASCKVHTAPFEEGVVKEVVCEQEGEATLPAGESGTVTIVAIPTDKTAYDDLACVFQPGAGANPACVVEYIKFVGQEPSSPPPPQSGSYQPQGTFPSSSCTLKPVLAGPPPFAPRPGEALICLEKTANPNPVRVGQPLTFILTQTNRGPDDTGYEAIVDQLPSSVSFVSAKVVRNGIESECGYRERDHFVLCDTTSLRVGETAKAEIVVTPNEPGSITNNARDGCFVNRDTGAFERCNQVQLDVQVFSGTPKSLEVDGVPSEAISITGNGNEISVDQSIEQSAFSPTVSTDCQQQAPGTQQCPGSVGYGDENGSVQQVE